MSEEIKSVRLSKIIKEYNIALPTIVDFLAKKGIQIESNPNAKIDAPALNLIKKEFAKDKQTKEESLKFGARLKEQTNEKEEGRTNEVETPIDEEVVTIRTNSLPTKPTPQKETETKKVEVKVEEVGPKKETPKEEPTVVAPVSVEPKKEEPKKEEVKVSEEPKKEPEKKESSKEMPGKVKVVGKIDLEAPNKKHERDGKPQSSDGGKNQKNAQKPEKKEDKHPEKKVEAPKQETKVAVKTPEQKPAQNPEPKFIKTPEVKLQGVKVVDTIDLTKFERPKPTNDRPNGENKKKKRKRIEPGSRPNAQNGANAQNANQGGKNQGGKNQQGSKKDDRNKKKHQPVEEPVGYTAEEVNKKLSETIASQKQKGKSKSSVYRREKRHKASEEHEEEIRIREEEKKILKVTEFVTANELATMMNIPVTKVISTCMSLGILVSINQRLNAEVLAVVAEEFGFKVEFTSIEVQEAIAEQEEHENPEDLIPRVPIVTVMGHVDHGKTKLLDFIRHSNVVAGEAGGITQHIGAYEVTNAAGKKVTFLDTPGHEAFTAMRARGASVTDVAIIVIAADSKVMPQTIEAINHAQAANVPIVFAINKIDLPTANPQKIYEELSHMNILVEEWGGKYQSQEISAKSGLNVDKLLDKVLLEAEMLDLKGNPKRSAKGTVIESALDKGRGYIAKILVQDGTLRVGDIILAGTTMGKVKAMFNERNQPYKEAGPSTPVLLLGLNGAPQAGDSFVVMEDEKEAKNIVSRRQQLQREQGLRTQKHITLDEIGRRLAIGDFKELNIIVKGDVDGSVEALTDSLLKLSTEEVQVNVIHKAVGAISESDVSLASASDAVIVAFNVRPTAQARKLAEREQIDIRVYSIIYTAIEEIKAAIEGMLAPKIEEVVTCNIEIREVFNISKVGRIAGCQVLEGKVTRQTKIRVIRDGIVIHTGTLGSLKRFKDDVKEVSAGFECGLNIQDYNEIQVGDIIEGYVEKEVSRKL